jgi:UDP-GlcNAc:undecaprenyl-phosphate GlcNAc-1-phosphate transferase
MASIVGTILTAFTVSVLIFPILIKYSQKKNIQDVPGYRRIHTRITPSIGGVAIFLGFLTSTIIWIELITWGDLKIIVGILFISFLLGLCDDLVHIKPVVKIVGQALAGSLAFFLLNIRITSSYGLFGNSHLPYFVSYFLTVFSIIIIINSFNLIDGIDGLAGSFSAICLAFYGTWFFLINDLNYSILCFALMGSIAAFLIFNWEPSKIFMGDTGTLLIGAMLALLTIRFMNINFEMTSAEKFKFGPSISTAICIIILPLIDTTRIIIIRLSRGISPLTADKRHIHHYLVRLGLQHKQAVLLLIVVQLFFLILAICFNKYTDYYLLPTIIIFSIFLCFVLDRFMLKKVSGEK